jgi:hypothetical protein
MKKLKLKESGFIAFDKNGQKIDYYHEDFKTVREVKEHLKDETMGGVFTICKVQHIRKIMQKFKVEIKPCVGGWGGGHRISEEDETIETKKPFCTRCGYKLKVTRPYLGTVKMSVVKPLVQKEVLK